MDCLEMNDNDFLDSLIALPSDFYNRCTVEVARDLLGCILVHQTDGNILAGRIVETEAYGPDDPANHAWRGQTRRNRAMFGPFGHAYVYKIYGMYYCLNAVTYPEGVGEAVLIRAVEPLAGIEMMKRNRGVEDTRKLCSGPGKLCQAFGIDSKFNHAPLTEGSLRICSGKREPIDVITTPRIGISQGAELPWRFCIANSPFLSKTVRRDMAIA
jgi:DNA-3-methyladenine glycosylase